MNLRLVALTLAVVLGACSADPGTGPASASPAATAVPLRDGEFSQATVDEALTLLAESGIAVFDSPAATDPTREIVGPASPVRLLLDQVRALALEAHEGGGIEGAEIDALFDVPPDLAPPSYVLAGYVAAVDTPGAQLARSLMGVEDWTAEDWRTAAPSMVYPKLVLLLFTSDVARERQAEVAAASRPDLARQVAMAGDVMPPPGFGGFALAAGGPCSAAVNWIGGALKAVFDAVRLGEPSSGGVTSILVRIWNFVVSILETIITTLVKQFEQTVLDWIGRVAAIVGTVATVISWVQPWTASVAAEPFVTEKGIGSKPPEAGALVARVALPVDFDWPIWAADCAEQAGKPLPNMKPEGTPVTWESVTQGPSGLIVPETGEAKLDAQGSARMPFMTGTDLIEPPYESVPGRIYARVRIDRQSLREFAGYLQRQLWKELPSFVAGVLQTYLGDSLRKIDERLGTMISVAASGPGVVIYHIKKEEPPPDDGEQPPGDGGGGVDPGGFGGSGEFCRRYQAYVDWAEALPEDTDITQALAAEIARRFDDMYPVAPQEMREWVALVWSIYATFAEIDEPVNIPATGQVAGIEKLPEAIESMHRYCGIPWPG